MKATKSIVGSLVQLTPDNVTPWPDGLTDGYNIDVVIGGTNGSGSIDGQTINVVMQETIAVPKGACIEYIVSKPPACPDDTSGDACEATQLEEITEDTRIAVLDKDNCPTQFITIAQLLSFLSDNLTPTPLCEQLSAFPQALTADTTILGLQGCDLVQLPSSAFECDTSDPEDFTCE